jgi:hypothetical protein
VVVVPLVERMRGDLTRALKAADRPAVAVLRTTLAAIANAEAPAFEGGGPTPTRGRLAEHARIELSDADIESIVFSEIDDRQDTIDRFVAGGKHEEAAQLAAQIAILRGYLA